jgi:predicted DNA binding CopG/RHH family protein
LGETVMANGKRGVSKGTINNPMGANQYAAAKGTGEKGDRVEVRLSAEDKRRLREAAQKNGMSLSSWILSVVLEAAEGRTLMGDSSKG